MFFSILLIIFIFILFRKQTIDNINEEPKKELLFCLAWLLFYIVLSMVSCAIHINLINEAANWLFLVLFPLFITGWLKKENLVTTLKKTGLIRFNKKTLLKTLIVCILYQGTIILIFSLGGGAPDLFKNILSKFPKLFCIMIFTAAFTEEFFFRGILQRTMVRSLKRPYIAILLTSILFGLYHYPFAFYLWDETAGSIANSLKTILTEQAVSGFALGLIYYKSNETLWSSIILHAFINAAIMSLGTALSV